MHISKAPKIDLQPCVSSQLAEIGHCPDTNHLAIRFKAKTGPGSLYYYPGVSRETFLQMRAAESIGRFFGEHIKPLANHIKIDEKPLELEGEAG